MDAAPFDDRTLRRTMARLVALADLAERAAGRCFAVRFLVLLVLRYAEDAARGFVAEAMRTDGLWFDDGYEGASRPEDAVLLAQRFRILAAELGALLSPAGPRAAPALHPGRAPRRPAAWTRHPLALACGAPSRLNDTS